MKNEEKFLTGRQIRIGLLVTSVILIAAFGLIVADTVTRPLDVQLTTRVKIWKETEKGKWKQIDEVGPATLNLTASIVDLATGKKLSSDFAWRTNTKNGDPYACRLTGPANVSFNPASGQVDGNGTYEITYKGKSISVPVHFTSESLQSPTENLKGTRAKGILGRTPTHALVVSINHLQPAGEASPLIFTCTEEYNIKPK